MDERYDKILSALMNTFTVREAATKLGCSEGTVYGALRDPAFQKMYKEARHKSVEHSITILSRASSLAVTRLVETVENPDEKSSVRLSAAKTILEFSFKGYELEKISERIDALEEAIEQDNRGNSDNQDD